MNIKRFLPHVASAIAIISLVLVTNESYRHVRGLLDVVNQSKQDLAQLKRDVYVLQVQLDTQPTSPLVPQSSPSIPAPFPTAFSMMPSPIGQVLPLPDTLPRPGAKQPTDVDSKSLMSVTLMNELKSQSPAASASAAASTSKISPTKTPDGPRLDVQLIGDAK